VTAQKINFSWGLPGKKKLPGLIEYLEPIALGMPTTNSADFGFVLSG
jgi:hypothetical protein